MNEEFKEIAPIETDDIEQGSFQLLKPKQQRFVHMYLSGKYKISEIADILKVTEQTVRGWVKNPKIKTIIEEYQQSEAEIVQHNLKALSMKALNVMNDLLSSDIDGIRYQAAKDLLDRTGFKPSTKQDVKVEIYNYEQQIKQLVGDNIELLEDCGYEIDGE
jgi:predicted DNA-binding protein YlxM (UPF0122 family)